MAKTKIKFRPEPGVAFRTTAEFKRKLGMSWRGRVLRPHTPVGGCWTCRVDEVSALQYIHESWMEAVE